MADFSNSEVIIDVSHLVKDYGYHRGVFDVSIQIHKGECYGYLGPNGAGKSTTIRHIMGFSKPTTGSIKIFGKEAFENTKDILLKVGYLPGEVALPDGLDGNGFLRMMEGMRGVKNDERLNELIKMFKFNPNQDIKMMSLGDKRKLAVVAAFMHDPEVLILDEPTSGLDPIMQEVFTKFVLSEKKRGKTILLSSHIFSEIDDTCDTISIIKDGIHVSTFKAGTLKTNDKNQKYIVTFKNIEDFNDALNKVNDFKIVDKNEKDLKITYEFLKENYDNFMKFVDSLNIINFEEKPFTLQDYFMSFYKENRDFGGLKGIKDNQAEKGKK